MRLNTHSGTSLEERFRSGDETALSEVYRLYSGAMFATALNLLGNRDLAADAVQQAFVQAWRAAGSFDVTKGLRPWLYAITRRSAIDVYRRQRRASQEVRFDDAWLDRPDPEQGQSFESAWQVWQVREALDQLHPDERQVLQFAYYGGMTQSEVARELNLALGTVKSRTARALRRLSEILGHLRDDFGDDPDGAE
ncbi:RNA polymerase sigma factor [Micromonospora sp. NPDC000089]|uniref:RNA polymerase sigma factor n=1 Tax=unclassified Micromonospora TaxID=2617518 RepID=UPI00367E4B71